jgi:hypothetical protein
MMQQQDRPSPEDIEGAETVPVIFQLKETGGRSEDIFDAFEAVEEALVDGLMNAISAIDDYAVTVREEHDEAVKELRDNLDTLKDETDPGLRNEISALKYKIAIFNAESQNVVQQFGVAKNRLQMIAEDIQKTLVDAKYKAGIRDIIYVDENGEHTDMVTKPGQVDFEDAIPVNKLGEAYYHG